MSECLWQLSTELTPDEQLWLDEQRARQQEIAHWYGVPPFTLMPTRSMTDADREKARSIATNAILRALAMAIRGNS